MNTTNNLTIEDINVYKTGRYKGIEIRWSSDVGLGTYDIYYDLVDNKIYADSEKMDNNEDKEFVTALLRELIKKIEVVG